MKLSVITDEISMDFAHALDVMSEYNVQGAELRGLWGKNLMDLDDDGVQRAIKIIKEKGAVVSCIASPLYKCDLNADVTVGSGNTHFAKDRTHKEQLELLEHAIRLADKFDTRLVRVFSFWRKSELTPEIEDRIIEELSGAVEIAEKNGIVLALENEPACYLGSGEETARVLRKINSPYLGAIWDPGNAYCMGEVPYPDGYEAIKDFIVHIHLKDVVGSDEKTYGFVTIGDGRIDYQGQFRTLKNDGYKGWMSLETHFMADGSDAETGSSRCLAVLNEMLQNLAD